MFTGEGNSYASYKDCYSGVKKEKLANDKNTPQKIKDFFSTGGFEFLSSLEQRFDCGGLCKVPLFYVS